MGKFGWSYPPGCSGPADDGNQPSQLVENILALLEEAGIDEETNDKITALVEKAEARLAKRALREQQPEDEFRQRVLRDMWASDDVLADGHLSKEEARD